MIDTLILVTRGTGEQRNSPQGVIKMAGQTRDPGLLVALIMVLPNTKVQEYAYFCTLSLYCLY